MPRGRFTLLPTRRTDPRASLVAGVLQLLLVVILGSAIAVPIAYEVFQPPEVPSERVRFIAVEPMREPGTTMGRVRPVDGGDGRPLERSEPGPPMPVPEVPSEPTRAMPEPGTVPLGSTGGGRGPLVGGGGPTQGVRPSFNDPRLWLPPARPGEFREPFLRGWTRADTLQALVDAYGAAVVDSLRRVGAARGTGPWVAERDGRRYGIDGGFIRLGDFALPTAVLALLPLNIPVMNMDPQEARRLRWMYEELIREADRPQRDGDFHRAVQALRERKERERREAEAARRAGTALP